MAENRTRIKVCGITNVEDARAAVDYGCDVLGYIRVEGSPRYLDDAAYHSVMSNHHLFVHKVAVVARPLDAVELAADYVQFYEEDDQPRQHWLGEDWRHIRAFRVLDESSLQTIANYKYLDNVDAILLDTFHKDMLGGSGETFNWELAVEAKRRFNKPIILAGGLTPENVGEAVAKVRPYAVDVSSGVEAEPGRKDHAKLKAFIDAVRDADRRIN